MRRFDHFIGIDWSGASGERHRGIALAICEATGGPPRLLHREKSWSRPEVLDLLLNAIPANTLIGLDLGISLPFLDCGAFFPGWGRSPPDAKSLWALVDMICQNDPHLSANSLVDHHAASRYFRRHGGREGDLFHHADAPHRRGRFRVTEAVQAQMGCKPYSNFNLVGAAQVGKSSLTGMRLLHRLAGRIPVWPVDPLPANGSVIVEIYTALAAIAAGRTAARAKITSYSDLDTALANLDSPPVLGSPSMIEGRIDDHSADALLAAAWLRRATDRRELWNPPGLTTHISRTEGWTFGAS